MQGTSRSTHTPSRKALPGGDSVGTISDTWIRLALHSNSRRVEVVGKLGLLAGPVFMLVHFPFYAHWWCVFAAHQKSGRHTGPRHKVVGQITFQAYMLKDWPFKVDVLCAWLYLPLRVHLSHRRPVFGWHLISECALRACPRRQKKV